jgi:nucleoid-associated protein YgaU
MSTRLSGWIILVGATILYGGCAQTQRPQSSHPPAPAESDRLEAVTRGSESDPVAEQPPVESAKPASPSGGNSGAAPTTPAPSIPGVRTHVVQPGETLWGISQKYYGDGKGWHRIFSANRNRITDARDVPVGTKLIIP